MKPTEQEHSKELENKTRKAATRLRNHLDSGNYKHTYLRFIFLEYVSNPFEELRTARFCPRLRETS